MREDVQLDQSWVGHHPGAMKRVYLLRHAKSSWKHPELLDHDRPLAGRGRRAAKAILRHMRAQEFVPELVLCSSARRARETLERIEPALRHAPVWVEPELYGASADELLARLRRLPDDLDSVLVIGHNPGMHELALELAGSAPDLAGKFPTAALATLAFHGSAWGELGPEATELVELTRPRDL
jgi:phosphohistidine phosphatase